MTEIPESQNIEWKSKWKDEYLEWIGVYVNAQGGKIYIGCDDDGNVIWLTIFCVAIDKNKLRLPEATHLGHVLSVTRGD